MSLVEKILTEGFGNTDKKEVLDAVNEIRKQGQINPFNSTEILLGNKVLVEVGFFDGALWVSSITSVEKGGGSYGMKIILDAADKHGVITRLSAEPYGKKQMNKSQLTAWYKRLGFKSKGYGQMERLPKIVESVLKESFNVSLFDKLESFLMTGGKMKYEFTSDDLKELKKTVSNKPYIIYRGIGLIKDRIESVNFPLVNNLKVGDILPEFLKKKRFTNDFVSYSKSKSVASSRQYLEGTVSILVQ
ncbi:MAG: hypothetical protein ABIP51_03150, partial [Bacteroidia bacterium]